MAFSEAPPLLMPVFFAAFVANAAYVACLFTLKHRLASVSPDGAFTTTVFGASPVELFRLLGFVFSGRGRDLNDSATTGLVWAVRILLPVGCLLTAAVFGLFLGAV